MKLIALTAAFMMTGCVATSPIKSGVMKEHLLIHIPKSNIKKHSVVFFEKSSASSKKHPVVFFSQGSGGNNHRAEKWSKWFAQYGVASVIIDNAGVRGLSKLSGNFYDGDIAPALEAVRNHPRLDLTKYAVMGFSRGGTAVLESGAYIKPEFSRPDFVFALYPGTNGKCPNAHKGDTKVLVFYGELDVSGTLIARNGSSKRGACESMAKWNDNASFYVLKNAHHGYDGDRYSTFRIGEYTVEKIPNPVALKETQDIILKAMRKKWTLPK